jgi:hypothetical protein
MKNPGGRFEPCPIDQSLIAELESAHTLIMNLNDQDVKCILRGDLPGSAALALPLADARIRRDLAIEAIHARMSQRGY